MIVEDREVSRGTPVGTNSNVCCRCMHNLVRDTLVGTCTVDAKCNSHFPAATDSFVAAKWGIQELMGEKQRGGSKN